MVVNGLLLAGDEMSAAIMLPAGALLFGLLPATAAAQFGIYNLRLRAPLVRSGKGTDAVRQERVGLFNYRPRSGSDRVVWAP